MIESFKLAVVSERNRQTISPRDAGGRSFHVPLLGIARIAEAIFAPIPSVNVPSFVKALTAFRQGRSENAAKCSIATGP
jgi:hypothetical protein